MLERIDSLSLSHFLCLSQHTLMSLQLSMQSISIHIFGLVTLNPGLFFSLLSQIILHAIYMIQNDYQRVM